MALCLPQAEIAMNRRAALTELGSDARSLRPQDGGVVFDLGLGALQVDCCIRTGDAESSAARTLGALQSTLIGAALIANLAPDGKAGP